MIICLGLTPTISLTMRFERMVRNTVNRADQTTRSASGKGINAARAVHAMGAQVLAMGFAGGDSGAFIREELTRLGIAHDFVQVDPPTRTCITVIDASDATATELIGESQAVDPARYPAILDRLAQRIGSNDVLVLSGSLPPGAPEDFYARCVAIARKSGAKSIVDATGPFLREALKAQPTLVKPNLSELVQTVGLPGNGVADVRAGIERLIELGAAQAVITAGAAPVLYGEKSAGGGVRIAQVTPPAIRVVSPIGSGDVTAAGIALALHRGDSLDQAVMQGVAMGCANAMKPVAGVFDPADVNRLLAEIREQRPAEPQSPHERP